MRFFITIYFILFVLSFGGYAQTDTTNKDTLRRIEKIERIFFSKKENGYVILPLLYYTPDTDMAFGAVVFRYFRVGKKQDADKKTRLSYVKLLADYSLRQQIDIWSSWNIFLRNEEWLLRGEARLRDFPDYYYGIGNSTPESNQDKYSYLLTSAKMAILKQIFPYCFAGVEYRLDNMRKVEFSPEGTLGVTQPTGYRGGLFSGLGTLLVFDNRDNVVNASKGHYVELSSYFYERWWGSDVSYTNLNAQYSTYFEVIPEKNHILALQFRTQLNFGDVPFTLLAPVGGDEMLRGYPRYRYRDLHFSGLQAEYRMPIYQRTGVVFFSGLGDNFGTTTPKWDTLKYSLGTGLRFALQQKEKFNLRLDYGIGRNSHGFYISVAEAF